MERTRTGRGAAYLHFQPGRGWSLPGGGGPHTVCRGYRPLPSASVCPGSSAMGNALRRADCAGALLGADCGHGPGRQQHSRRLSDTDKHDRDRHLPSLPVHVCSADPATKRARRTGRGAYSGRQAGCDSGRGSRICRYRVGGYRFGDSRCERAQQGCSPS